AAARAASRARSAAPSFLPSSICGIAIASAPPMTSAARAPQRTSLRHGTGGTSASFAGVHTCSQAPRTSQRVRRGSARLVPECIFELGLRELIPELLQLRRIGVRTLGDGRAHLAVQDLER